MTESSMPTQATEQPKKPTLFDEFKTVPLVFKILAFIPIVGITQGGALGGAIGGACCYGVIAIAKKDIAFASKLGLISGMYLLGIALYMAVATLLMAIIPH